MARRGIANCYPPGSHQRETTWWRDVLSVTRDGVPDATTMLGLKRQAQDVTKPTGTPLTSSSAFGSHFAQRSARQDTLNRTGLAIGSNQRPSVEACASRTLPALGFRTHYHPTMW
mmetsp:Transcript_120483/g.336143  ORF Transcript_120483/g.336143 Transcript_120483/m.336143 type:complete len:115 (-) Transcript_120483:182-526(-)